MSLIDQHIMNFIDQPIIPHIITNNNLHKIKIIN
jgi:hypothetical protein